MKFFFFILTTTISLGFDRTKESNESLWLKLTNYQNVTGISDNIKLSIWQQSRAFESERKLNRRRRAASQGTYLKEWNLINKVTRGNAEISIFNAKSILWNSEPY